MGIFARKAKGEPLPEFDREKEFPVLRCSICNGEQVAGFKDRRTGHFREWKMIRGREELEAFRKQCGVDQIPKEY